MDSKPPDRAVHTQRHGRRATDVSAGHVPPQHKTGRVAWIPRPPEAASKSTADFIVAVFAITVATILVLLTVGVAVAGIFGSDISSYFAILTSIMTSMISALVGYLAGKGQGRIDATTPPAVPPAVPPVEPPP